MTLEERKVKAGGENKSGHSIEHSIAPHYGKSMSSVPHAVVQGDLHLCFVRGKCGRCASSTVALNEVGDPKHFLTLKKAA